MHGRGGLDIGWRLSVLGGAVLAGTGVQLQQAATWSGVAMVLALAAALPMAWCCRHRWPLMALAVAVIAFAATDLRATARLSHTLPPALEGQDLTVTGRIVGLPQETLTATRFMFEVEQAPVGVPPRLSLSWFRGADGDAPQNPKTPCDFSLNSQN